MLDCDVPQGAAGIAPVMGGHGLGERAAQVNDIVGLERAHEVEHGLKLANRVISERIGHQGQADQLAGQATEVIA
jgi:hypothetical protein